MPKFLEKVDAATTAVLVIDMQNDFVAPGAPMYVDMGNRFAPKLGEFLDICRDKGLQIIYTTYAVTPGRDLASAQKRNFGTFHHGLIDGTEGVDIYPPCAPKYDRGDILVKKHYFSAFAGTDLEIILRAHDIRTLIITGVCTDICCFATARDAYTLNYDIVMISDLNGTPGSPDCGVGPTTPEMHHAVALNNLFMTGCDVIKSEEFLAML